MAASGSLHKPPLVGGAGPKRALQLLKRRSQFLAAARGRKCARPELLLQCFWRGDDGAAGVGFTASKKVGGAVVRNRAKRRLRALARAELTALGQPGFDYVLIARRATAICRFEDLRQGFLQALARVHDRESATARAGR